MRKYSKAAFTERYRKWRKRRRYLVRSNIVEKIYSFAKNAVVLVPKSQTTKVIIQEDTKQLTAISCSVELYRMKMNRLAAMLPEYPVVMQMFGVGDTFGPQLLAKIGDVRRFARKQSLVASAGIDPTSNDSGDKHDRNSGTAK